jgi:hypothetical protein
MMHKANINDRASIEALYPRSAFAEDAGRNALGKTPVLYGVRIGSAPDEQGWFSLVRHHIGEPGGGAQAVFLSAQEPHLAATRVGADPGEGGLQPPEAAVSNQADEYRAFIDSILDTARSADFEEAIGRGDPRLRGFHGG